MRRVYSPNAGCHYWIVADKHEKKQLKFDGVTDTIFTRDELEKISLVLKTFQGRVVRIEHVPVVHKEGVSCLHGGTDAGSGDAEEGG